jgi:hypothetical protein
MNLSPFLINLDFILTILISFYIFEIKFLHLCNKVFFSCTPELIMFQIH